MIVSKTKLMVLNKNDEMTECDINKNKNLK